MKFELIGPAYQSQSVIADNQACRNWYLETIESGTGKSQRALYPTPGTKPFANLPGMANVREHFFFGGRFFAVGEQLSRPSSQVLFEVTSAGAVTNRGALGSVGSRPSFAANQANQMMVASGGQLFLYNLSTDALTEIDTLTTNAVIGKVAKIGFSKAFFVALIQNSSKFQISGILDGNAWDPTDFAEVSDFPDQIFGMIVDHSEIALFGSKQSIVYYASGNPDFPFDPVPGGFVEGGILAPDSIVKMDNTIYWIGADERGGAMAFRAQGYTPSRVSTHAIEYAWQQYATAADATAFSYQELGHTFWMIRFPSANKTWAYDVATGVWHERSAFDGGSHKSQCHTFAFGKHLVGDPSSGNIYEMSSKFFDDAGTVIPRMRRSPHLSEEDNWLFHKQLRLDVEGGLGPQPPFLDGAGHARGPKISLRWSDDGGRTWSSYNDRDAGQAGEFRKRIIWRRLGRARDRIYEVSATDPVPWRLIEGYLEAEAA